MAFEQTYTVVQRLLPVPSNRRSGRLISPGVRFIVAHDTGNPGSTADQNVRYYASTPTVSASAHLFVDDTQIIECIPALKNPEKAWHVLYNVTADNERYGFNANDAAIGVEYCYGDQIDAGQAYRRYVWLLAWLCHLYGLDPATSIIGHFMLDPHRKTDPATGLARSRRTYDQLLLDVPAEYRRCLGGASAPQPPAVVVRTGTVCATWDLNIRLGQPNRYAPVVRIALPGERLPYIGVVTDGESVNGNRTWYQDAEGNYFWSGATAPVNA